MDRRRYLRSVAAAGTVVAVAGCTDDSGNGDDGNGMGNGEDTATPTDADATPTGGEDASPTATPDAGGETATPPPDPDQRVAVGAGLNFDPDSFEISVGETVLWEWVGSGHSVKYDDGDVPPGTDWDGTEGDRTDTYGEGHVHFHTFEVAGHYDYYCVPHRSNGMTGSFTVTE